METNIALPGIGSTSPAVLDCTLRDGGYYTQWDFTDATVDTYFQSVARLPISVVEAGYCSVLQPGYRGRFHYLTRSDLDFIRDRIGADQQLAVMVDAKAHSPSDISQLFHQSARTVSLVRLAMSPEALETGLALAEELRSRDIEVGVNIMYLSRWWQAPGRLRGIEKIGKVASTISVVDSYGACEPPQVRHAVEALRELFPTVKVGFHGHDNLGLAMANSLAAIDAGAAVIDSTMSGMGRGAGNTSTQALLIRQAARTNTPLDLDALTAVVNEFEGLKSQYQWGTSLPYLISGASDLPQKDVMDWVGKNRYTMVSILRALKGGASGGVDGRDFPPLTQPKTADEVLIIGGGQSVVTHNEGLARYIALTKPHVVHASHRHLASVASFGDGQLICLTGDGLFDLPPEASPTAIKSYVVASGPRLAGTVPRGVEKDVAQVQPFATDAESSHIGPVSDTAPLALGLGVALRLGAKRISFAGFDGYENASVAKQNLSSETQLMIDNFLRTHPGIPLGTLTRSSYSLPSEALYGRISDMVAKDFAS